MSSLWRSAERENTQEKLRKDVADRAESTSLGRAAPRAGQGQSRRGALRTQEARPQR